MPGKIAAMTIRMLLIVLPVMASRVALFSPLKIPTPMSFFGHPPSDPRPALIDPPMTSLVFI